MTPAAPEPQQTDLREYLRVLRSRKWQIVLVTLVVVGAAMFFTFRQTPLYEGTAKVLVNPVATTATNAAAPQRPNLETERELIDSQAVASLVKKSTGAPETLDTLLRRLSVQVVTDTEVLLVAYRDPSPSTAARYANAFATGYVGFRTAQALSQFELAATAAQQRIGEVQKAMTELQGRINRAAPGLKETLQSQRDLLVAQLGVLEQRLLDIESTSSVSQSGAQIVQDAEVPSKPVSPDPVRNGVLAVVAGLALGVGLAFLRERFDDRVKTRQEIERRTGAPLLASVPRLSKWRKQDEPHLALLEDPKGPVSEAYRTLGTNVQYLASQQPLKVLLITSALSNDGKTTTAANLGVVLAQAGKRVILVSADIRKPRLHRFFALNNRAGLTEALSRNAQLSEITRDPGVPNLRVVTGGTSPQDPAALLGGLRTAAFLGSLREVSDFVILDSPPVLAVADASILAPHVDGTIFVLDAERASRSSLTQARDQLLNAGANIVGTVFNNFDPAEGSYYSYYYYNYDSAYLGEEGNGSGTPSRIRRSKRAAERHAD